MRQRILVYGTLRKGGLAEHKLKDARYIALKKTLPGYALYDAGWYPLAVPAVGESIVADSVEVPSALMPAIDAYEGEGYKRSWLAAHNAWLYVYRHSVQGFPKVASGDWLSYWEEKRKGS